METGQHNLEIIFGRSVEYIFVAYMYNFMLVLFIIKIVSFIFRIAFDKDTSEAVFLGGKS